MDTIRTKSNEMRKRSEQNQKDSEIMHKQLLKFLDANTIKHLLETKSVAEIEKIDFQQYLRKSPSLPDIHRRRSPNTPSNASPYVLFTKYLMSIIYSMR